MELFTIGFTKKSAKDFFTKLKAAGVRHLVDIRLNNTSQLAGFAKKEDLAYFLQEIGGIEYVHLPQLAPTQDILDAYKQQKGDWQTYETQFLKLMRERQVENTVSKAIIDRGCLLCSEEDPSHCHRRLVAEYLAAKWSNVRITHLV
ncbi:MAG: DUF488 domain-containing protein [Verrucomicrobia bacterium]|nr:DUF488 domain-containing protein [Verrucomicrobiota bacterium]